MKIKKLDKDALVPTKAYEGDLGWDLYAIEDVEISHNSVAKIKTGIAIKLPDGTGAIIKDRSSMASKNLHVLGGVIDHNFSGEIVVLLANLNAIKDFPFNIKRGDKIAQLVLVPILFPYLRPEEVEELPTAGRGKNCFGSSGK